jgi:transposase-like protein
MLQQQHTVSTIAQRYGVARTTLSEKLTEAGIDSKAIRNAGKQMLRATLFNTILSIPDEDKRVKAGLQYLERYPIQDDEIDEVNDVSDEQIRLQIIKELSDG